MTDIPLSLFLYSLGTLFSRRARKSDKTTFFFWKSLVSLIYSHKMGFEGVLSFQSSLTTLYILFETAQVVNSKLENFLIFHFSNEIR